MFPFDSSYWFDIPKAKTCQETVMEFVWAAVHSMSGQLQFHCCAGPGWDTGWKMKKKRHGSERCEGMFRAVRLLSKLFLSLVPPFLETKSHPGNMISKWCIIYFFLWTTAQFSPGNTKTRRELLFELPDVFRSLLKRPGEPDAPANLSPIRKRLFCGHGMHYCRLRNNIFQYPGCVLTFRNVRHCLNLTSCLVTIASTVYRGSERSPVYEYVVPVVSAKFNKVNGYKRAMSTECHDTTPSQVWQILIQYTLSLLVISAHSRDWVKLMKNW